MPENRQDPIRIKQPKRVGSRGFTLQLFLIIVLPITVLLLVVVFGSQTLHHEAMRNLVGDRDLKTVQATADSLGNEIAHLKSVIQILSLSLEQGANLEAMTLPAEENVTTFDGGLALLGSDGEFLQSSNSQLDWQAISDQNKDYFLTVRETAKQPVLSSLLHTNETNDPYFLISLVTKNNLILTGAFTPEKLILKTIGNLTGSEETSYMVISPSNLSDGFSVIFQGGTPLDHEGSQPHPGVQEVLRGESGIDYLHRGQGEHVVAYSPIPSSDWGLILEEAWEDISSPLLARTQSAPLVLVPVFLLALLVIWFGAQRIVNPLQKLEKQAARLAEGDFEAIQKPVGGISDIQNLQNELIEMAERLQTAQQNLHGYIGTITSGIENERLNLARELHDDTIQALIALNQRIQLAGMTVSPDQKSAIDELQGLVQQALTNLRRMIRGLRPIYLEDLGLVASLEMLVQEMEQSSNLPIKIMVSGEDCRLEPQKELMIYRMVQESLNNVIQHAAAKQAWVFIIFSKENLKIQIKDDGKGFLMPSSPSEFPQKGHFGLLGLYERADLINAQLEVISSPGAGTTVSIQLVSCKRD
ncbi:MAG: histidine kinase [Anaerolineaceae bacterium]